MPCLKKINKNWGTQLTRNDTSDGTQFIHYEVQNGVRKVNLVSEMAEKLYEYESKKQLFESAVPARMNGGFLCNKKFVHQIRK